jgi:methylisocitrate lyase
MSNKSTRRAFIHSAAVTGVAAAVRPLSGAKPEPQPQSTARTMGARFRELLRREQPFENVGAYDSISAQLVEAVGFPSIILGSSTVADHYGNPGWNLTSTSDYLNFAGTVARSVNVPTVIDIEMESRQGTLDPAALYSFVKDTERAGLAGMHFGDGMDVMGQRKGMLTTNQMIDKIRAAADARSDLVLIVRCNGLTVEGMERTLERAAAYVRAGADGIYFSPAMAWEDLPRAADAIKAPLAANMASDVSMAKVKESRVTIATYLTLLQSLAQTAVYEGLMELKTTGLTTKSSRGQRLGPALPGDVRGKIHRTQEFIQLGKKYNMG